jgi:hypothetical protein
MLSDITGRFAELASDYIAFEDGEPKVLWAGLLDRAASLSSGRPDMLLLEERLVVLVDFSVGCGFSKYAGACERKKRRLYSRMMSGFADALRYFFIDRGIAEYPDVVLEELDQLDDVLMAAHRLILRQGGTLDDALVQIGESDITLSSGLRVALVADAMLRAYALRLATT